MNQRVVIGCPVCIVRYGHPSSGEYAVADADPIDGGDVKIISDVDMVAYFDGGSEIISPKLSLGCQYPVMSEYTFVSDRYVFAAQ